MNAQTEATENRSSRTALSVRNDPSVNNVAMAVRRNPPRSSAARGVSATVRSHKPAANGKSSVERELRRTTASPPGAQVSADVLIEKFRVPGNAKTAHVAKSINVAAVTARRRRRSTSSGNHDAHTTTVGRAAMTMSQNQELLIGVVPGLEAQGQS